MRRRFHIRSPALWLLLAIGGSSSAGLPIWNGPHQLELGNGCPCSWGTEFQFTTVPTYPTSFIYVPALTLNTLELLASALTHDGEWGFRDHPYVLVRRKQRLGFTLPSKSHLAIPHTPSEFMIYPMFEFKQRMGDNYT